MSTLFFIVAAFAIVAIGAATIGTRGRYINRAVTQQVYRDELEQLFVVGADTVELTDAEIHHLLDDTQEIEAITDTQEITALGGF